MFLMCTAVCTQEINCLFSFIQENSVLVGIITSIIASSLWFRKFINQKRAEAFFGFYSKLSLFLKSLQTLLEENGQLNTVDAESGNIYTLIYTDKYMKDVCPKYKNPEDAELELYRDKAKDLKKILFDTNTNVYPQGADRKKWLESQQTLFNFCEYIENNAYQKITNESYVKNEDEPKHIVKCKRLVESFNYIQESINNARY